MLVCFIYLRLHITQLSVTSSYFCEGRNLNWTHKNSYVMKQRTQIKQFEKRTLWLLKVHEQKNSFIQHTRWAAICAFRISFLVFSTVVFRETTSTIQARWVIFVIFVNRIVADRNSYSQSETDGESDVAGTRETLSSPFFICSKSIQCSQNSFWIQVCCRFLFISFLNNIL